jgi:hypothetical protein
MTNGSPWAIISASHTQYIDGEPVGGKELPENEDRMFDMIEEFYTLEDGQPTGYIPIDGVWCEIIEKDKNDKPIKIDIQFEDSLFIPNMSYSEVVALGGNFDQHSVFWGSGESFDDSYYLDLDENVAHRILNWRILPHTEKERDIRFGTEDETKDTDKEKYRKDHPSWELLSDEEKAKKELEDSSGATRIPGDRNFIFDIEWDKTSDPFENDRD